MNDRATIARILSENRYCVLGTADAFGTPWVTPVFFAPLGDDRICWVSSPDSRHSRNIASRTKVAITVFDSTVAVGHSEAAYFDTEASPRSTDHHTEALRALNARLPESKQLRHTDLQPNGPMSLYQAHIQRRFILIRGGNPAHGNTLDMSLEVLTRLPNTPTSSFTAT